MLGLAGLASARQYSARPLLLPPLDWRERMLTNAVGLTPRPHLGIAEADRPPTFDEMDDSRVLAHEYRPTSTIEDIRREVSGRSAHPPDAAHPRQSEAARLRSDPTPRSPAPAADIPLSQAIAHALVAPPNAFVGEKPRVDASRDDAPGPPTVVAPPNSLVPSAAQRSETVREMRMDQVRTDRPTHRDLPVRSSMPTSADPAATSQPDTQARPEMPAPGAGDVAARPNSPRPMRSEASVSAPTSPSLASRETSVSAPKEEAPARTSLDAPDSPNATPHETPSAQYESIERRSPHDFQRSQSSPSTVPPAAASAAASDLVETRIGNAPPASVATDAPVDASMIRDLTSRDLNPEVPRERPGTAIQPEFTQRTAASAHAPVGPQTASTASDADTEPVASHASVAEHEVEMPSSTPTTAAIEATENALSAESTPEPIPPRESTPPVGIRPSEVRRPRRPAPPTRAREVSKPDVGEPPVSAQATTDDQRSSTEGERSMDDWRRLLFEATGNPLSKAPSSKTSAPVAERGAERGPRRSSSSTPDARDREPRPHPDATRPTTPSTTTPLLESTRRFLRPRVGIDPATVPIIRGPEPDRLVSDAGADAVAVGEAIALPSEHDERAPRTLGILAHELTHVAQRRDPPFIPPAIRAPHSGEPSGRGRPLRATPSSEEELARHVERAVWSDAERVAEQTDDEVSQERAAVSERLTTPDFNPMSERDSALWGTLPAPWEPLSLSDATTSHVGGSSLIASPHADAPPIRLAERGRSLDREEHASSSHGAPTGEAATPPDLDALARRVYDVLKRRLSAERRREG
jgi:hypothetical protein